MPAPMDASRRLNANTATTDCRNTRCAPSQSPAPMRWATCTEKTRSRGTQQSAEEPCGCRHQAYRRRGLSAEASNHRCVDILHHYRRQLRHNRRHTQHHRQAHLLSSRHSPTFADHRQQPVCLCLYSHNSKCKINLSYPFFQLYALSLYKHRRQKKIYQYGWNRKDQRGASA